MIQISKVVLKKDLMDKGSYSLVTQLVALSQEWVDEDICSSYKVTEYEDFINRTLYVVFKQNTPIGYALGDFKKLDESTSYNNVGEVVFELDEIYVSKSHRGNGLATTLFEYLENDLKGDVDLIGIVAESDHYLELLSFYQKKVNATFKHALFVKRMDGRNTVN